MRPDNAFDTLRPSRWETLRNLGALSMMVAGAGMAVVNMVFMSGQTPGVI